MTPLALFNSLMDGRDRIVLRKDTPHLAHLGAFLSQAFDKTGSLILEDPKMVNSPAFDYLQFTAHARICNVPSAIVMRLLIEKGAVTGFYILAPQPDTWSLSRSFSDLGRADDAGRFLGGLMFEDPILVVAGYAGAVSDFAHGIENESFANGVNIISNGLKGRIPASVLQSDRASTIWPLDDGLPDRAKLHLMQPEAGKFDAQLTCWWPRNADIDAHVQGCKVLRPGWVYTAQGLGKGDSFVTNSWMWEVQNDPQAASFTMLMEQPIDPGQSPTYSAIFPTARFLNGGAHGLAAFTDGQNLSAAIVMDQGEGGPELALAAMRSTPGQHVAVDLVAMDKHTGAPYVWDVIPGAVTLRDITLSLGYEYSSPPALDGMVRGIATIEGYEFQTSVRGSLTDTPHIQQISGALWKPHEVHTATLLGDLFGHDPGLPNLDVSIIQASYDQDFANQELRISMDVAGHIDLFGNGMFLLDQVGFDYAVSQGAVSQKAIRGKVEVAGLPITMKASYDFTGEWDYTGQTDPHEPLKLSELLSDLMERIDLPVPPGLPDIAVTEIGAGFSSLSRDIHFWGRADWTPPKDIGLPWHVDTVHTVIDVVSSINEELGTRQTRVDLNWLFAPKEGYLFEATARHAPGENAFFASWSAGNTDTTLGLSTVGEILNLDALLPVPIFDNWSLFEFNALTVGYQSAPRQISMSAQSRLGEGALTFAISSGEGVQSFSGTWHGDALSADQAGSNAGTESETASIGLADLLDAVRFSTDLSVLGSDGLDAFSFTSLQVEYTAGLHDSFSFTGAAGHSFYREVFVSLQKDHEQWGMVAGISFEDHCHLADIPGLGELPAIGLVDAVLSFEPSFVMLSTIELRNFTPPIAGLQAQMALGPRPAAGGAVASSVIQSAAVHQNYHLDRGATIAGRVVMAGSENPLFQMAHDLIGVDALDAVISLGETPGLIARIPGELKLPIPGDALILRRPYFGVKTQLDAEPVLSLGGDVTFSFMGEPREVDVALFLAPEMMAASFHLVNVPLPPVRALPGVKFSNDFFVEMAIATEPPGFDLGFQGTFHIGPDSDKNVGKLTLVMDLTEGMPHPKFIRFNIDKLTFWSMFEATTGLLSRIDDIQAGLNAAHDGAGDNAVLTEIKTIYQNLEPIFSAVSLNNCAFHWADSMVVLPDGSTAMPGVGFKGRLDLFGFDLYGAFDFATGASSHFSARLEMEPVHLGEVLKITGDGKGLRQSEVTPLVSGKAKLAQGGAISHDPYLMDPGGPVFVVSSQHAPYLHASLHVELFDELRLDVTADVDNSGLRFKAHTDLAHVVALDLTCQLGRKTDFDFFADGTLSVHLKCDLSLPLPRPLPDIDINIDGGFDAEVSLHITNGLFVMTIQGDLDFEGAQVSIPKLTLHESFPKLSDLPTKLLDHVIAHAPEIFADMMTDLSNIGDTALQLADASVDLAEKRVAFAVDTSVKAATAVISGAEDELNAASEGIDEATKALTAETEKISADLDTATKSLEEATDKSVAAITSGATAALSKAEDTVNMLTGGALGKIPGLKKAVAAVVGESIKIVGDIAKKTIEVVNQIAHDAIEAFNTIITGIDDAIKAMTEVADFIFDKVSQGFKFIAGAFKDGVNAIGDGMKKAANWTKNAISDIGDAIGDFFGF